MPFAYGLIEAVEAIMHALLEASNLIFQGGETA